MRELKWKNLKLPRAAGLLDRALGKVRITGDPGGALLRSGRVVALQHRYEHYQSRMKERLLTILHPLETELGELLLTCEAPAGPAFPLKERTTTGAIRAANAEKARQAEQRAGLVRGRVRLSEILREMEYLCARTDCQLDQALCAANTGLAVYAKAAYFSVVDRQIPAITRTFYADQLLNKDLLLRAKRAAGENGHLKEG